MILLRVLGLVLAIVIGSSVVLYVFTRQKKWLRLAWGTFRIGLVAAVAILLLFALERLSEAIQAP